MKLIDDNKTKICALCDKYRVRHLFAFGSVTTPRFNAESDIDLLVDFNDVPEEEYVDNYFGLKFQLADLFGRKVDLIEEKGIRNPVFLRNVINSRIQIYG